MLIHAVAIGKRLEEMNAADYDHISGAQRFHVEKRLQADLGRPDQHAYFVCDASGNALGSYAIAEPAWDEAAQRTYKANQRRWHLKGWVWVCGRRGEVPPHPVDATKEGRSPFAAVRAYLLAEGFTPPNVALPGRESLPPVIGQEVTVEHWGRYPGHDQGRRWYTLAAAES